MADVIQCKIMHFGRANPTYDYYMSNQKLETLGVIISSDLKPSQQCNQAYAKANRILGMITRTISYKSRGILLQLYKSLVRPHLEYCTVVWSPYYQKDKKLLEKIQRRFTRMIPGSSELPYESRLKSLNLWTLEDRRLIEVYKMYHGLSAVEFGTFFELDKASRTRGHFLKLKKRCVTTDLRQHFFTERVINIWNHLDTSVVEAATLYTFKSRLQRMYDEDESFLGRVTSY